MVAPLEVVSKKSHSEMIEHMNLVLANTYSLYLNTQHAHWNVIGPHFPGLHQLFESQYSDLATAIDDTAERVRALGGMVESGFVVFNDKTSIQGMDKVFDAMEMVEKLHDGHLALVEVMHQALRVAEKHEDDGDCDYLGARIREHEKQAWMLRSILGKA